jgi:hypothetical protein
MGPHEVVEEQRVKFCQKGRPDQLGTIVGRHGRLAHVKWDDYDDIEAVDAYWLDSCASDVDK